MKLTREIRAGFAALLVFLALGAGIGLGQEACAETNSALTGQESSSDASVLSLEDASGEALEAAKPPIRS